ncbi:hypothetical protein [Ectopseudomonas mendocina]|uniref:hypothetical protein n=1 Tax=Ectopseudomonas mendocina TaxID=300 RepID=UPI003F0D1950
MTATLLRDIIIRDRGQEAYADYASHQADDLELIAETATRTLASIPRAAGHCVMISAGFVAALRASEVPAVVILGDLLIDGKHVFRCYDNLPRPTHDDEIVDATWDGHAWVMIGESICDLSIFRTAYELAQPNRLSDYILRYFGTGKGAFMCYPHQLPPGMEFVPKFALTDDQIYGLLEGLSHQARAHQQQ